MSEHGNQQPPIVFISYSRRDCSPLAEELVAGLEVAGFDAVLDRHDIAAAEDWEVRLENLIQSADSVIVILSPESVKSPRCGWEVNKGLQLSKRLVPVIGKTVTDAEVPEPLRRLNYVFFTEGHSFARALGQVAAALRADLGWIREHTRLDGAARRWQQRGDAESLLLRDDELAAAQVWKAAWAPGFPDLTEGQLRFIAGSADAQAARDERERQQRDEFALAQSARAEALAARAEALAEREGAVATLRRRTVLGGIGAGLASLGLGGLGYRTWWTQGRLRDEQARADRAQAASLDAAIDREAARVDIEGQLIAFAASPGEFASDGEPGEDNSPYTKRLLEELTRPNASLQDALSQAGRRVLEATRFQQRPYVASDLNGELYIRRKPESRTCRAIVLAVDHAGVTRFRNPLRDGSAWAQFLHVCGFEVTYLSNPTYQEAVAALDRIRFVDSQVSKPPANTCAFLFFSGGGVRDGRDLLLLASDSMTQNELVARPKSLDVTTLATALRQAAAASLLVLDTAFPDVRG